jgi:hypothetical protein
MATIAQFEQQFGHSDRVYEFWYGKAIPTSARTFADGLLQAIIGRLLTDVGLHAASNVELCIDPNAHPKPDLIATKTKPHGAYPLRLSMSPSRLSPETNAESTSGAQ